MTSAKTDASVVLVHAAWTDGSSWNKVTEELQRKGLKVVAAQIPLTSFTDDVAVLKKVLLRQKGPIVLAGHSYGGAVITAAAAGNADVKALDREEEDAEIQKKRKKTLDTGRPC
jgi:alpha-beta hydrolase superfamily lysophospholipase